MGGMTSSFIDLGMKGFQADMQRNAALSAQAQGRIRAAGLEDQAIASVAQAQQLAAEHRKRARYARSRALAVAGASGAGVHDPGITDIISDIETTGEMNALTALANGRTKERLLMDEATIARTGGQAQSAAQMMGAFATGANAFMDFSKENPTFFQKYSGNQMSAAQRVGVGTGYSDFASQPDSGVRYA